MRFENRQPVEDLYTEDVHPLKELAWLLGGSLALILVLVAAVGFLAGWVAGKLPYAVERDYAASLSRHFEEQRLEPSALAARTSLRELSAKLEREMDFPPEMRVSVHYRDEPVVNAFATLGGNIVVFRGLIEQLDSEEALAMVLAHEMAHIRYRHPVTGLGRGLAVGVLLSTISASLGELAGNPLSQAGTLSLLKYSRSQEREADEAAFQALGRHYGQLAGAREVFTLFEQLHKGKNQLALLQTHPLTQERAAALRALAQGSGLRLEGQTHALPAPLAALHKPECSRK